jgi:hypothetical protein
MNPTSVVRDADHRRAALESIREKIGSLTDRLNDRVGRSMAACRTCGTPTRSHVVGDGRQCHTCHEDGKRVLATDGGRETDASENGRDDDHQRLITEAINRWLANHEPLSRAAFDRINSALVRTLGEPVDHPTQGRNVRFREADAAAFGEFACEHDVALVELDADARYGDLHGYPVAGGGRWVPVLVTTDDSGGVSDAERRIHDSYHTIEDIAPSQLNHDEVVATDGGQPESDPDPASEMCDTLGCENAPVADGYCAECADISPGILDSDDGDATEEEHRASDVSHADGDPEREPDESGDTGSHNPVEGETSDTDPGCESEESDVRADEAFAEAIAYFQTQLGRDISDLGLTYSDDDGDERTVETPREWFKEVRGWSDATIDEKRVGWASPYRTGLLDHLMGEGYDRDEILATGLFTEDLSPLWQGRFVFPYFDSDGQPVYAISRATGDEGGGAAGYDGHPDDGLSGKYAKPAHTKDYARVEEPIYGLDTVADGHPVLITEGIADAITAHQAGYPCISPVTTRFKRDDREALRAVLEYHDIPRAYVAQDAERPSSDLDEDGRLTLTQVGEGLSGALDTAAYLAEHEIDARVAELPRPGLDKVDLDDYLREWATDGTLGPVLAGARPAREHPAYDPQKSAIDAAERDRADPLGDDDSDESHSALFDLDIQDATGLDADFRGPSPLGHHGDSETYFVVIEKRDVAYDHKYKSAYTPLTYLLCETGERSPDNPNGRLSDEEMFASWRHAKREGLIPDDDPIPRRALRHVAVEHDHCERDEIEDGWKFPSDAYDAALDTVADDYDCEPGRDPLGRGWGRTPDAVDPLTLDVVLDPETAWRAASAVSPDDLDEPLALDATTDGERWQCPQCSEAVDVVRAVAIHHGTIGCCEEPLGNVEYDAAYRRTRTEHGAPLPEYVDARTATDNWALVQGAVAQLTHWHLSTLDSTVTGLADDNDDVIAELNPTWEESSSEKRILAFRSGAFYCREHDCTVDPLRVAALEQGIIDECDDALAGEDFTQAYHVAREQYGAPLPEWDTGNPDHVPVLPPADDLLGEFTTDRDALDAARENVEDLYRELASDPRSAWVLNALPALGKTTSVVKNADEYPALYLAPRKELQQEVAEKARSYGRSFMHLPIFAEDPPNEGAVKEGTELVREDGKDVLRDPEELVDRIEAPVTTDDEDDEDDGEDVEIDRASCATANGGYSEAWQLAVHVARAIGHSPQDIHLRDTAIFGETLPCHDDCECGYKLGWDRATDADNPRDILIGHYVHGHVQGARKYVEREDGQLYADQRVIAIDEFPGDAYDEQFGEEFPGHAAWLARALHDDVEDRQDVFERDLWNDDLTRAWLRGDATTEIDALAATDQRLTAMEQLANARTTIEELHETLDDDQTALADAFAQVQALGPDWERAAIADAHDALSAAVEDADQQMQDRIENDVLPAFVAAERTLADDDSLGATTGPDRLGGDLAEMVERAVDAFREDHESTAGLLKAAQTALGGGEDGCRELAAHARDGYAHPLAHLLLQGIIADGESTSEIPTEAFDFDNDSDTDGTNLKSVECDRETVLTDRNHQGALVRNPPAFRDGERVNPVVGLDATGRERLWQLAIGCEVEARDIHDSPRERRAFLRDVLNLQVVQTTPHTKTYSGSPNSKNFDGDVALIEQVADEYAATQLRRDTVTATSKPGVITTKKAREEIEDRIADEIADIDHYGNITGSNAFGALNLGVVLGCRHFGDEAVEKWAALAGETVNRNGSHGVDLNYRSETANTFLKHMREDQTLQAILRFGRDKEGAVVFAHTAALAESLPVVADGAVVKAFSASKKEVARAAKQYRSQQFEGSDIAEDVTCSRRTVQRVLNELAEAGYLAKRETKDGLANEFRAVEGEGPGVGEAELPELDDPFVPADGPASNSAGRGGPPDHPDETPSSVSNTGFVWVVGGDGEPESSHRSARATLPAPDVPGGAESAAPPG